MTRKLYIGGEVAALDAPIGFQRSFAEAFKPAELDWATQRREARELEIQLQIVSMGSLSDTAVRNGILWQVLQQAHGDVIYSGFGSRLSSGGAGPIRPQWPMLARGIRHRLSARYVRVSVMLAAVVTSPVQVVMSIQPCDGETFDIWPSSVSLTNSTQPFPMGALEWRVEHVDPAQLVTMYGRGGTAILTQPASAYFDWSAIPPNAFAFDTTTGANTNSTAIFRR